MKKQQRALLYVMLMLLGGAHPEAHTTLYVLTVSDWVQLHAVLRLCCQVSSLVLDLDDSSRQFSAPAAADTVANAIVEWTQSTEE